MISKISSAQSTYNSNRYNNNINQTSFGMMREINKAVPKSVGEVFSADVEARKMFDILKDLCEGKYSLAFVNEKQLVLKGDKLTFPEGHDFHKPSVYQFFKQGEGNKNEHLFLTLNSKDNKIEFVSDADSNKIIEIKRDENCKPDSTCSLLTQAYDRVSSSLIGILKQFDNG